MRLPFLICCVFRYFQTTTDLSLVRYEYTLGIAYNALVTGTSDNTRVIPVLCMISQLSHAHFRIKHF